MTKKYKGDKRPYSSFSDRYSEENTHKKEITKEATDEPKVDRVKVTISDLNIRKGAGKEFDRTGKFTGPGIFEIVDRQNGYGKLKSGEGWISLEFCQDV